MTVSPQFACPKCDEQIPVTVATRDAILRSGCPRCTAGATPEHFTP